MRFSYYIGKIEDFYVYNKVKLPWAVHICEAKCTCGEATFLIAKKLVEAGRKATRPIPTCLHQKKNYKFFLFVLYFVNSLKKAGT